MPGIVPVALALLGTHLDRKTVAFVGWFGPRGLASLVFALLALEEIGSRADEAVAVIAATVFRSVLAQPGLRVLLLPVEGDALPGQQVPDGGGAAGGLPPPTARGARGAPEVVVAWQGGEPTMMGLDFFRRSIELQQRYARPGQRILTTLQTNGTLLDDDWGVFLRENDVLVGISIDGPRQMHDTYRVDKGGKPTFDRVLRGLDVLKRHGVDWNVLTTVNAANGDHGQEVYRFLRDDLGATFVQFIPIVERATPETFEVADTGWGSGVHGRPLYTQQGSLVTHRSVGPEQYGRFLVDVFEDWVRSDIGTVYVQMFDTALANWIGEPGGMCVHAETCGEQVALEHNGDVYACDHYVEPNHLLGNIGNRTLLELVALPQQQAFGQAKRDTLTRYCRDCDVRFACHGGCPKDRFATSPYGEPGQHYLCAGYRAFFSHVRPAMEAMTQLLGADRAPAQLMDLYAAGDARRGRNEPCTCGGGKKWKHCHGAEHRVAWSDTRRPAAPAQRPPPRRGAPPC